MTIETQQRINSVLSNIRKLRIYEKAVVILANYGDNDIEARFFNRPSIVPIAIQMRHGIVEIHDNGNLVFQARLQTQPTDAEMHRSIQYNNNSWLTIYNYTPGEWVKMINPSAIRVAIAAAEAKEQAESTETNEGQKSAMNLNGIAHSLGIVTPSQS